VFGLDLATGAKLWQSAMPKPAPPSRSVWQPQTTRLPRVYAGGAEAYYIWDGTHMTAYRAGDKAEVLGTSPLRPDIQFLDELAVSFDGNDSMFIGGHGIFAVDTRTGGCRWAFTQPYDDLNLASAAAGVGTYYIAAPKDGGTLEEKVFALAVD
jgi:outer membrane protein assembly factor BamB